MQEDAAYERHVPRQLRQEPGEDVDSFVLRLRQQVRHCGYGVKELEFAVRDQLLFEVPNIQLAAASTTERGKQHAARQTKLQEERKRAA